MTPVRCVDWRDVPVEVMARLYDIEATRWRRDLHWDTASNWSEVERGRQLGTVRGTVAFDERGAVVGWGFALAHAGTLQVGELVSSSRSVTDALVDELVGAHDVPAIVSVFSRDAEGAVEALTRYGLSVAPHQYLVRSIEGPWQSGALAITPWRPADALPAADLLRRAYVPDDPGRPCAPSGTREAWEEYVSRLVCASGCGTFDPAASGSVVDPRGRIRGLVLATRLSPTVGHIAQVAVDVDSRGTGIGRQLVDEACRRLVKAGCQWVTLFVDERNVAARALYARLGFECAARFVSAGGVYPRRSTSPLAGAATITRR